MADASHVALPRSDRPAKADATRVRDADPAAAVEVTLSLRGRDLPEAGQGPPEPISREELASQYGASQSDVDAVRDALGHYGLTVPADSVSLAARTVVARGTVAQMQEAFGTRLAIYQNKDQGEFRGRDGDLSIPRELDGIVIGVFGLDERRVARRYGSNGASGASTASPMGPAEFEQHYSFPAGNGTGQTIGIAEFGGGYFDTDLRAFNKKYGRAMPNVVTVPCGAPAYTLAQIQALPHNQQQEALNDSGEVMLDVEVAGSLCPGAELVVYFAPFTQKGWVDLLTAVIDGTPASPLCLSVSWGLAEDAPDWSSGALQVIDQQLGAVAKLGITVLAASGDDGSGNQVNDGKFHVNFPASSPNVLAVGGTQLDDSSPPKEVVWWQPEGDRASGGGSTGGGVSTVFSRPAWQTVTVATLNSGAGAFDGRVVPDVSALAGPPFYDMIFQGKDHAVGGTSAATPLWAALLARLAASKPGAVSRFMAPLFYTPSGNGSPIGQVACRDVVSGDNASPNPGTGYKAGPGFDAVSGWGTPQGSLLVQMLGASTQ